MVVDEFGALRVNQLAPEMFVLEQIEEIQTHRVFEVFSVFRIFPIQQVFKVVYECGVFEITSLG